MEKFSELLNRLSFTAAHLAKAALLQQYFATTPDPDRGYTIAIIAGTLDLKFFKRSLVQELVQEEVDPYLFSLSYDYVGDFSETAAYLWPDRVSALLPTLSEVVAMLSVADKVKLKNHLRSLLDAAHANQRWALLKLGTGSLRIGVSARFIKQVLAQYGHKDIHEIEMLWHTLSPPYVELFAWLEGRAEKPAVSGKLFFSPVMLSHPLADKDLLSITAQGFFAEWKYDGIRIQLVDNGKDKALFSRTGDNISHSFPDVLAHSHGQIVLDGELIVQTSNGLGSFNQLQQRLNRKNPSKKLIESLPGHIIAYDLLELDNQDLRTLPFVERRQWLQNWHDQSKPENISLSPLLAFSDRQSLINLRAEVLKMPNATIEGLMLKRKDSLYIPGRPAGLWYKWKHDPHLIDAVLMYAQRGHGKRCSFYSDYTFGLWQDEQLLPIGKAYFGFTDAELKQLDAWIRRHIVKKFGPVAELEKLLVLEIAFDAVQYSSRHKSGYALRFPRVSRIRWDKPAAEADSLLNLAKILERN
jgi:DNA ligase-1